MKPQLATGATAEAMATEATVTGLLVTDIVLLSMAGIIAELIEGALDIVGSAGVEVGSDVGSSQAVGESEANSTAVE